MENASFDEFSINVLVGKSISTKCATFINVWLDHISGVRDKNVEEHKREEIEGKLIIHSFIQDLSVWSRNNCVANKLKRSFCSFKIVCVTY